MGWTWRLKSCQTEPKYGEFGHRYFLMGTIDPRPPAAGLAIFQILFSVSCLITASVYVEQLEHNQEGVQTSAVLGLALTVFSIQIVLSGCALFGLYSNNTALIMCQVIWHLISPVVFGSICAVIVNEFAPSPHVIGYLLIMVTFISTPICAVDALMVLTYFKAYQLIKYGRRCRQSTPSGSSNDNPEAGSTCTPTTLTLSSVDHQQQGEYYEDDTMMYGGQKPNHHALLPPPSVPPPRRYPPTRHLPVYSISGRATKYLSTLTAESYSSMRWTQGGNFAELIHRTPTGQFVLNLREAVEGRHTDA